MYKRIVLLTSLLCISLHATATEDGFDLARIKDSYKSKVKYATYLGATSLLCHFLCSAYSANDGIESITGLITLLSCFWGTLNTTKWLFVHFSPQCTSSDIDFIEKAENLLLLIVALQTKVEFDSFMKRQAYLSKIKQGI
jgi:hypothetical protein